MKSDLIINIIAGFLAGIFCASLIAGVIYFPILIILAFFNSTSVIWTVIGGFILLGGVVGVCESIISYKEQNYHENI